MTTPKLNNFRITVDNGVAVLSYDIPKANALTPAVVRDMIQAHTWALNAPEVKVIVLTGEGKFFTAGLNLTDVPETGPVLSDEMIDLLSEMHQIWIKASKVLIAAINGPAVGYGTSSIALFDLVYAVPDAFFATPFVKVGLCAEACSSITFWRSLGRQKAASLILAGDRWTAQEAESAGLVTKILSKDTFREEVLKIAIGIANQPAGALLENKKLLMEPMKDELLTANEREVAMLRARARTDEPRTAMEAFAKEQEAKRKKAKL